MINYALWPGLKDPAFIEEQRAKRMAFIKGSPSELNTIKSGVEVLKDMFSNDPGNANLAMLICHYSQFLSEPADQ